jgi:hypothetical protein
VRLGIIADIHGNDVALRAVLEDADHLAIDRWWALGDLVLSGPRPAEVLEILHGLPGIGMLRGNTDRYVLTGEQPAPHATAADAVGSIDMPDKLPGLGRLCRWPLKSRTTKLSTHVKRVRHTTGWPRSGHRPPTKGLLTDSWSGLL